MKKTNATSPLVGGRYSANRGSRLSTPTVITSRSRSALSSSSTSKFATVSPKPASSSSAVASSSSTGSNSKLPFYVDEMVRVEGFDATAVVRYVGSILSFDPSEIWVGIEFDQPCGKCDGKVRVTRDGVTRDQRYFTCAPNHGCFMKATNKSVSKILTSTSARKMTTSSLPGRNNSSVMSSPAVASSPRAPIGMI